MQSDLLACAGARAASAAKFHTRPVCIKKILPAALVILFFAASLSLTFYPLISSRYNASHQSEARAQYSLEMETIEEEEKAETLALARQYNASLVPGVAELSAFTKEYLRYSFENYANLLDPAGTGVMGYVIIPKIGVSLPILHGTGSSSLENGVGHLLGTSLPVGGESTHTVLTGHSGMAGNRLFSDLPELEIGDDFYLEVLGQKLYYEIDQIITVLPYESDQLRIVPGEDYCTLITCTPFGINTHRLLVRGTRVYMDEEEEAAMAEDLEETASSTWELNYMRGIAAGCGVVVVGMILLRIWDIVRRYLREKKN